MLRSWIYATSFSVFLLGLYVFTNTAALLLAFLSVLALVVISVLLLWRQSKKIYLTLNTSRSIYKNDEGIVQLRVENNSNFPLLNIRCEIVLYNSLTGESTVQETNVVAGIKEYKNIPLYFKSEHIGKLKVRIRSIKVYDYLRLFFFTYFSDADETTYVLPQFVSLQVMEDIWIEGQTQGETMASDYNDMNGTDISGLKEYAEGEPAKHIHWKLTSKFHIPIVKEFELPREARILVLYDASLENNATEISAKVETFLSLSNNLRNQNIEHQLAWYENDLQDIRLEEVNHATSWPSLLNTVMEMSYQNPLPDKITAFIEEMKKQYSYIYVVASENPEHLKPLDGDALVTVLAYAKTHEQNQTIYGSYFSFTADTLQEDLNNMVL